MSLLRLRQAKRIFAMMGHHKPSHTLDRTLRRTRRLSGPLRIQTGIQILLIIAGADCKLHLRVVPVSAI